MNCMWKGIKSAAKKNFPLSAANGLFCPVGALLSLLLLPSFFLATQNGALNSSAPLFPWCELRFLSPFFITKVMEIIADFTHNFSIFSLRCENEVRLWKRRRRSKEITFSLTPLSFFLRPPKSTGIYHERQPTLRSTP